MKLCAYQVFLLIFSFTSCKHSPEPEKPNELIPYMSLSSGDIHQYYLEKKRHEAIS